MSEEFGEALKEIAGLLRRLTEQHDASAKRLEVMQASAKTRTEEFRSNMERIRQGRLDPAQMREDMSRRMEEARGRESERRQEDLQFRDRLLQELERHNRLLESLISRLGRSS